MDSLTDLIGYFLYQWARNIGIIYHMTLLFIAILTVLFIRARYLVYQAHHCSNFYSDEALRKKKLFEGKLRVNKFLIFFIGLISAIFVVFVMLLNSIFIESWLHYQLGTIAKKLDAEIEYSSLKGNIITGHFQISDFELRVKRRDKLVIDLIIPKYTMHMANYRLPGQKNYYRQVELVNPSVKIFKKRLKYLKLPKLKHHFQISRLNIQNAIVLLYHSSIRPNILVVNEMLGYSVSSAQPLFDLLFKGKSYGKLNGKAFSFQHFKNGVKHQTNWIFDQIPLSFLNRTLYYGLPSWFDKGQIKLTAIHQWQGVGKKSFHSQWKIHSEDLEALVPRPLSTSERKQVALLQHFYSNLQAPHDYKLQSDLIIAKRNINNQLLKYLINKGVQDGISEHLQSLV